MTHRSVRSALSGRGFLLLPAAALAVHQLRYRFAYGSHTDQALAAQGHGYLDSLAPWAMFLVALALGAFLARVARAAAGRGNAASSRSLAGLWGLAWVSLVAIYATQETVEEVFAAGHPGGLSGIFGHGGWWAIVIAAAAGFAVAALLRFAAAVVATVARTAAAQPVARPVCALPRPAGVVPRRRVPLASASAGRAPPSAPSAAVV